MSRREVTAHLEWLGFVKPTGLVVSPVALAGAGAILNRRDLEGQRLLKECVGDPASDTERRPPSFHEFARKVLGWSFSPKGYAGQADSPVPAELVVVMSDSDEAVRPCYAVRMGANASDWQLLVITCTEEQDFDQMEGKSAAPHIRMERLLRHTDVTAGLLFNGRALRLVSAPKGESSGWLDFHLADMVQTAGRPICTAMRLLLNERRLLTVPTNNRLAALLEDSRKYQNEVSKELSEQVLHALYELLRGFQAAHDGSKGTLLAAPLSDNPDEVYRGLLTLVLRLIFLLYAEERDMLAQDDEVFLDGYSLTALHKRLREEAALYPDTMDQRYGAYAQLLVLFRMIHDGARGGNMALPPRHGVLFDPDKYRFLEGRGAQVGGGRQVGERIEAPRVSDGTVYRVLEKLLVLKGERISYRALDVEHIGSVYETMMGFRLETAKGQSVAIKAVKKHGAPATVNLEALLDSPPTSRAKWIRDHTDRKITEKVSKAVRGAASIEAVHAALGPVVDIDATPDLVSPGSMVLQPSEERRRSGSHYTPRKLTEPIVRDTLKPVLDRLRDEAGGQPTPEQLLNLKVCDPAMGSGAFLVEVCRQLGTVLVVSWQHYGTLPDEATGEDELVLARREVARRCLYGVDRNPVAVDLAKMSLWLATLAQDLPLTFLDHALRHGDSLVGLTTKQIASFHWKANASKFQPGFEADKAKDALDRVKELRRRIREAGEGAPDWQLRDALDEAMSATDAVRRTGDLVLVAYFDAAKPKAREARRAELAAHVAEGRAEEYVSYLHELRDGDPPLAPFHWEIEFPEVFERGNPGFDAIVGNPPFAGVVTVVGANVQYYTMWLRDLHVGSAGKCDLSAHFFRRSFSLLRQNACLGLIATNTIAQGHTRRSGLQWICNNGGDIYRVIRRRPWPGLASVVVSMVHIVRGSFSGTRVIDDGQQVNRITAFLFHRGNHDDPQLLESNVGKAFVGSVVIGMGFTFDDDNTTRGATPLAEMRELVRHNCANTKMIRPYIGGYEFNNNPRQSHRRYVIDFRDYPLRRDIQLPSFLDATSDQRTTFMRSPVVPHDYPYPVAADWPDLLAIVRNNVKPVRERSYQVSKTSHGRRALQYWWQHYHRAHELYATLDDDSDRVLATSEVGQYTAFAFLPTDTVYANTLVVFPTLVGYGDFGIMQSQCHEAWAFFFGSTLKDDLRYVPSYCFETFAFPRYNTDAIQAAGKACYEFRADLMVRNKEGLTKTYNRFHDPAEYDLDIVRLRNLHTAMDRAVLDAYGWTDIPTDCEFLLDYEIDEEEWGRKKKPYRYRWPDDVRDDVLARLMELNGRRATEEARTHKGRARK